jgi:hypothetical protein
MERFLATGSILDSKIMHRKCVLSKNLDEIHAGLETSIILTCYGHSKFVCLIMMIYNKTATTVSQLLFTKHTMQIMKTILLTGIFNACMLEKFASGFSFCHVL